MPRNYKNKCTNNKFYNSTNDSDFNEKFYDSTNNNDSFMKDLEQVIFKKLLIEGRFLKKVIFKKGNFYKFYI
ncbi:hypothetical protein C2G38_2231335 [Gigaspora rosea]|uniref:Uncharacterized protein n=1 Tax=Gigaspora rosea TaxID=44941 RepID=A0A397TT23_9GLOM|nr:hypothetical protein C2G38_2231335 [Gigaspora rosea]